MAVPSMDHKSMGPGLKQPEERASGAWELAVNEG